MGKSPRPQFTDEQREVHDLIKQNKKLPWKFKTGDTVTHPKFGVCKVITTSTIGGEQFVNLRSDDKEFLKDVPAAMCRGAGWEFLKNIYEDGWVAVPVKLKRVMGSFDRAFTIAFLINWNQTRGRKKTWFYCTDRTAAKNLDIERVSVRSAMHRLKSDGFIDTEMKNGKRHVKINYELLHKKMMKVKSIPDTNR